MDNDTIDYSDIPETDTSFWKDAKLILPEPKIPISLRVDKDIIDWFKEEGKGYQSRINAVLRLYVESHHHISKT